MAEAFPDDFSADDLVAVVAHSLLTPLWACEAAAKTLIDHSERLTPDVREELLLHIVARARLAQDLLTDLVRGGTPAVIDALEGLSISD